MCVESKNNRGGRKENTCSSVFVTPTWHIDWHCVQVSVKGNLPSVICSYWNPSDVFSDLVWISGVFSFFLWQSGVMCPGDIAMAASHVRLCVCVCRSSGGASVIVLTHAWGWSRYPSGSHSDSSHENERSVIGSSPSCRFKPARLSFVSGTRTKSFFIFVMKPARFLSLRLRAH